MKTHTHHLSDIYTQIQLEGEHFHQAYWDLDYPMDALKDISTIDKSQREHVAQQRYLQELVQFMPITKKHTVLDLGCGAGGTAIWLAKTFGCKVHGIDIIGQNIAQAEERINKAQMEQLVQVQQSDALSMDFPAQTFDHVIGVEAIYHIEDRKTLFAKLYDLLKPGGYLVFSDYMLEKTRSILLPDVTASLVESKYMTSISEYHKILADVGFIKVDERNVGENTIAKLVEFQKATHFREIKYAFGRTLWSCIMISLFASTFANSVHKGVKNNAFQLNFMSYQKTFKSVTATE